MDTIFQLFESALLIAAEQVSVRRVEVETVHRGVRVAAEWYDRPLHREEDDCVAVELEILGCVGDLDLGEVPDQRDEFEELFGLFGRYVTAILYDRFVGVRVYLGLDIGHLQFLPVCLLVVVGQHARETLVGV